MELMIAQDHLTIAIVSIIFRTFKEPPGVFKLQRTLFCISLY